MKKFCVIIINIFIGASTLVAQDNDKSVLHTNQSYYIAGDIIKYVLYLPSQTNQLNLMMDVTLMSEDEIIIDQFYQKNNGQSFLEGQINLPLDIPSSTYYLTFNSTLKDSKSKFIFCETSIPIYNDLSNDVSINTENEEFKELDAIDNNTKLNILIEKPENISTRDDVNLNIKIIDENNFPVVANISVRVSDSKMQIANYKSINNSYLSLPTEGFSGKIVIEGKIVDNNGMAQKYPIIGAYSPNTNSSEYFQTDEQGNFSFELNSFYGKKSIQFIDFKNSDINVNLKTNKNVKSKSLIVTQDILDYLQLSRSRKKINQIFDLSNTYNISVNLNDTIPHIIGDRTIILDKYESFENMSHMFRELVTSLQFRTDQNGDLYARVFNDDDFVRDFYPGKPIFIIDGIVTKNVDFVNNLNMNFIDQIDIISDYKRLRKEFGPNGYNGVIVIKTSMPAIRIPDDELADIFTISGLREYQNRESNSIRENKQKTTPYFQPNLYWSSLQSTDSNGELNLSYSQSDDVSTFIIEVLAQDDLGRTTSEQLTYIVNQ